MLARTALALCAVLAAPAVMAQNYFSIQGDGVEFHVTEKGGRQVQTDDSLIGFSSVDFIAQPFVFSVRKGGKFYSSCTATGIQTSTSAFYFTPGGNGAGDFPVRLDKCGPHNGVTLTCFPKVGCPK